MIQHKIDLESLSTKTPQRLRQLREKYRELKWSSHGGGAGGVFYSDSFVYYKKVVERIDALLKAKSPGYMSGLFNKEVTNEKESTIT